MDAGTKVYKAYVFDNVDYYLMEAVATGIVVDGVEMARRGTDLVPIADKWHESKTDAKRIAHGVMVRQIGAMQAKADKLAEEILHEALTTEEVARGVA